MTSYFIWNHFNLKSSSYCNFVGKDSNVGTQNATTPILMLMYKNIRQLKNTYQSRVTLISSCRNGSSNPSIKC